MRFQKPNHRDPSIDWMLNMEDHVLAEPLELLCVSSCPQLSHPTDNAMLLRIWPEQCGSEEWAPRSNGIVDENEHDSGG
jgi:hypothetical protein